jgi:membrane-associated tyrosine- and threonine-specific cdc2-inhibitory kinase
LQGKFSKSVDVFSLGIAILELSCNLELPPNGPLWQELRNGILPDVVTQFVSVELTKIIRWMMMPNPFHRPTVDTLLQYPRLQRLLTGRKRQIVFRKIVS